MTAIKVGVIVEAPSGKMFLGGGWKFEDGVTPTTADLAREYPESVVKAGPSIDSF